MKRDETIRVCIVVASLDYLGGQAIQALRIAEGLSTEGGIEASLLPVNPRLAWPFRLLQRIKYVRTVVTSIAYIATLLVRLPRFDVIHVFSASYFSFLLAPAPAILVAKLYGKRVILNYHSGEAEDHLRRWPRTTRPIINLADRIVVPSGYLVDVFDRFGFKAEVISNTVDMAGIRFRERERIGPALISNRNLEKHYDVACSLRAFAAIQRRFSEASLIVAGYGSERTRLHALAAELGLKNIDFVGAVPPELMPALYDRADIFVNASLIDNQPLSIIEAFASGLPVVTTDAGGIPYLVSHEATGLIVPRGDHEALAQSVIRLLEDGRFAAEVISRAHRESDKYRWAAVGSKWVELYRELDSANSAFEGKKVEAATAPVGE
jgi:glycosyltransferase involved in cell wall biosynthesis